MTSGGVKIRRWSFIYRHLRYRPPS